MLDFIIQVHMFLFFINIYMQRYFNLYNTPHINIISHEKLENIKKHFQ